MTARRSSPLDGWQARVFAVILALAGMALMGWLGREELGQMRFSGLIGLGAQDGVHAAGAGSVSSTKDNPALAACLAERLGTVDKMNSDGILSAAQFDLFRSRAIAYCEAEFPPAE